MPSKSSLSSQDYLDPEFGKEGTVVIEYPDNTSSYANGITVDPDGKLLIAGSYGRGFSIVRMDSDGKKDPDFGNNGIATGVFEEGFHSTGGHITVLKSGEILLSGSFMLTERAPSERGLALFDKNGVLVKEFGNNGVTVIRPFETVEPTLPEKLQKSESAMSVDSFSTELPDGKLMVISNYRFSFAESAGVLFRLHRNGSVDTTFGPEQKGYVYLRHQEYSTWIHSMIKFGDKFAFAGSTSADGKSTGLVAVYNADGIPFEEFGDKGYSLLNSIIASSTLFGLALSVNNILAFGCTFGPPHGGLLVCLDAKGEPVKNFNNGEPVHTPVDAPFGAQWLSGALREDGKIVVVGDTLGEEDSKVVMAQYQPDGSLDAGFGEKGLLRVNLTPVLDTSRAIAVQGNDQIVVAGSSLPINDRVRSFVFRLR
jgi:uncharacterized delta-60 repeat protein